MPSALTSILCALAALALWGGIGFGLARRAAPTIPAGMALPVAPILGWACHSTVALPLYGYVGMTFSTVAAGFVLLLAAAAWAAAFGPAEKGEESPARVPAGVYALALVLAAIPAMALLPKISGDAVALAPAMFDHSKIALIDEMARAGVPPVNPFFAEAGKLAPSVAYYYLWHFSGAELAVLFGVGGWTADIALTGFTAFASLTLVAGLAVWISGRAIAGALALPLLFAASLYHVLEHVIGARALYSVIMPPSGLAGWLFQVTWAPQHVASAACLLLSIVLLARLMRAPSVPAALMLALTIAAGYQSSIWVGGVVGAIALTAVALLALMRSPATARRRTLGLLALAAVFAALFCAPFLVAQISGAAARGIQHPIALQPYPVLNIWLGEPLRHVLDIPAFWLILLVLECPAVYLPGLASLVGTLRSPLSPAIRDVALSLTLLVAASLGAASFLTITFADNNDLGWRAVLPGVLVLAAFAAAGLAYWLAKPARWAAGVAISLCALGLVKSVDLTVENWRGWPSAQGTAFARAPALWDAVRRLTGPDERVANNPLFMDKVTAWPANISWALFADRRSCYAGRELALPFAPVPLTRIEAIENQFRRVFAGQPAPGDLRDMAKLYQCTVIVVTPQDGAWRNDPFAMSEFYSLADEKPDGWRIYRAR
jgi:hypothetical protein